MSTQKIALITGANRGIGFETARQLGKQGIKVLIGARGEEKGKEAEATLKAEGLDVEYINIDVDNAATHATAAKTIEEKYGKRDILINNAGIFLTDKEFDNGVPVPASKTSAETFRKTFDTNFFNTFDVTQALLPLVKKSDAGRIVFLSSGLGSLGLHSDPKSEIYNYKVPAYNISKTALNGYVVHLAHELRNTNIKVNAAHPGSVVTDITARYRSRKGQKRRSISRRCPLTDIRATLSISAMNCPGKNAITRPQRLALNLPISGLEDYIYVNPSRPDRKRLLS